MNRKTFNFRQVSIIISFLILGIIYSNIAFAYDSTLVKSKPKNYQQLYKELIKSIEIKQFERAANILSKMSKIDTVMADEIAYFVGYTQINLGKYAQGKEALEKYIMLKSDTGKYAKYAHYYIHLADCNIKGHFFDLHQCETCTGEGFSKIDCRTCKGTGQELCNKCFGRGVIKSNDGLGEIFIPCEKCNAQGYYQCKKCNGIKTELDKCRICEGKGKIKIKKECSMLPNAPKE